jgi:hypothetical protein
VKGKRDAEGGVPHDDVYSHIIHDGGDYDRIVEYIENIPINKP